MPAVLKKKAPAGKTEKRVRLGSLKPGDWFRNPRVTLEEAISGTGEEQLFMVVKVQPVKAGRVAVVSSDGAITLERDDDHEVIQHQVTFEVSEAEMVDTSTAS